MTKKQQAEQTELLREIYLLNNTITLCPSTEGTEPRVVTHGRTSRWGQKSVYCIACVDAGVSRASGCYHVK